MLSKYLRDSVVVYPSERKPGFVYKYMRKDMEYVCCRCRELGKCRSIRVVNDTVVGRKHPEDDHHPDCQPLPQSVLLALEADRDMRQNVRSTGKRPREAYTDMLTNVAKKFKSSDEQVFISQI